jgi:hypothetical protein
MCRKATDSSSSLGFFSSAEDDDELHGSSLSLGFFPQM